MMILHCHLTEANNLGTNHTFTLIPLTHFFGGLTDGSENNH